MLETFLGRWVVLLGGVEICHIGYLIPFIQLLFTRQRDGRSRGLKNIESFLYRFK